MPIDVARARADTHLALTKKQVNKFLSHGTYSSIDASGY